MSNHNPASWTIDDIVFGNSAKNWLGSKGIVPSSWGLDEPKVERIKGSNVRLTIMCSPASEVPLTPNPLKDLESVNLVMLDANIFSKKDDEGKGIFTKEEIIAAILHEIGHAVYDMKPKMSRIDALKTGHYVAHMNSEAEAENAADDFAHEMGFGKHVASGLNTLARIMPEKFNNEEVRERIKRMEERS